MKKSVKKQQGFMSIEAVVVIAIVLVIISIGFNYVERDQNLKIVAATAAHGNSVADATQRWAKANASAIEAAAAPTAQFNISALSAYLPTGLSSQNPYGQSYSIRVYKPAAGQLQIVIVTTGGETIPEQNVRPIAQSIGGVGGYVMKQTPSQMQGSFGGWTVPFTNFGATPGAGHIAMALFFQDGGLVSDFLYRNAVSGRPDLNTMNTPINIQAKAVIDTSDVLCVPGETTTYGRVAADANGRLLNCVSPGKWKGTSGYWKDPVASFGALPITDNNAGDVRMTLDTSRGFMWNGSSWTPLAVDQNGNMTLPGTMRSGKNYLADVSVEGAACAEIGLQSRDSTGLPLSCQFSGGAVLWKASSAGIKNFVTFDWYPGSGTFGTGLPYSQWFCAISHVGGKWAGGGENIQVYRDGGSGTWIVAGTSSSDNSGAFASIGCVQLGG